MYIHDHTRKLSNDSPLMNEWTWISFVSSVCNDASGDTVARVSATSVVVRRET